MSCLRRRILLRLKGARLCRSPLSTINGCLWLYRILHGTKKHLSRTERKFLSKVSTHRDRALGEVEEILAAGTNDKADIVTLNGTRYLVLKRNKGDEYFYYFMSEDKNKKGIKGRIEFKKKDLTQGEAVLQDFLKNIKFK